MVWFLGDVWESILGEVQRRKTFEASNEGGSEGDGACFFLYPFFSLLDSEN